LVHHYFGSKDQLFLATVEMPVDVPAMVEEILSDGIDGIGARLARTILQVWESALQPAMVASLRAMISDPGSTRGVGEFLTLEVIGRIVARLDLPEAEANRRAGLVASQVIGLFTGRYLLQLPSLTSQSVDDLVSAMGPTIQNYLGHSRLKGS
jgi:AcrR family transcriptional regulator